MATCKELKVNRSLLNANFEGYRLSLDKLPHYEQRLTRDVMVSTIHRDMYAREHIKLFLMTNQLYTDRWNQNILFIVSKDCSVFRIQLSDQPGLDKPEMVYEDFDIWSKLNSENSATDSVYQPSLSFPSSDSALLTDGRGHLAVLATANRNGSSSWKRLQTIALDDSFVIFDSITYGASGDLAKQIFLSGTVVHDDEKKKYFTSIRYNAFKYDADGELEDSLDVLQEIKTTNVEYVSLQSDGSYLVVSSGSCFEPKSENEKDELLFLWLQDSESVTLTFQTPEGTQANDVSVEFHKQSLSISVHSQMLLDGELAALIDVESSTWTLSDNKLEITLMKKEEVPWTYAIRNFTACKQIFDPSLVDSLPLLRDLSSENLQSLASQTGMDSMPMLNQDLEICDLPDSDENMFLCEMSPESLKPRAVINLSGNQWLYSLPASGSLSSLFCVRHDVDGVLINYDKGESTTNHISTFNALGYILASKQKRRFVSSSPSHMFAVVADTEKHLYVYRQPEAVQTDMRNRKTGQKVTTTAKQQIIELGCPSSIIGLHVTDNAVYALLESCLFKYAV